MNDIVKSTIAYRLNPEVIEFYHFEHKDKPDNFVIKVERIFGVSVCWYLPEFHIKDIYQYFEEQIIDEILSLLIKNPPNENVVNFIKMLPYEVREEINVMMTDLIEYDFIEMSQVHKIINRLGDAGCLSSTLYHHITSGYFQRFVNNIFKIKLDKVKYLKTQNVQHMEIKFNDGNVLVVKMDSFSDHLLYQTLTRNNATHNLMADIQSDVAKLLINNHSDDFDW